MKKKYYIRPAVDVVAAGGYQLMAASGPTKGPTFRIDKNDQLNPSPDKEEMEWTGPTQIIEKNPDEID